MLAAMRHAASYGIVDRKLLFDRYLHRMSLKGMALYLFLALAADREGRSYYGDRSIAEILRFSLSELAAARGELIAADLVDYRAPYWWVRSLSAPMPQSRQCNHRSIEPLPVSRPSSTDRPPCDPVPIRGMVPEALKALILSLEGRP
jgi:hypothetical protein